jgi:hypothetical protein
VGKNEFAPNSLYLKGGDFRTEAGSIVSAQDVHATRYLGVHALPGHGSGTAELWYSDTAQGKYAAKSLYLKSGDFRTEKGSIISGQDLEASRYITLNALEGFGSGAASLWYCNREQDGYNFNSLYLKSGDFRTEKGSIVASADVVATEYLKLSAFPGYGQGTAELWYSATGKDTYRSETLYLSHGDFSTKTGSIRAGKDLSAGRYLEIRAWPGHGSGTAKLWHGKKEDSSSGSVLYLKSGDFQTQAGSLISGNDVKAGRYVEIGASEGYGTGSAKLWFSRTSKGAIAGNTLHLESGDFHTQAGGITAAGDVIARQNLKADKMDVKYASVTGSVEAGHLFLGSLGGSKKEESLMEETTEFLDVSGSKRTDVGQTMFELDQQLRTLSDTNKHLKDNLDMLLGKVSTLEQSL